MLNDNSSWQYWTAEKWERLYEQSNKAAHKDTVVRYLIGELRREMISPRARYEAAGLLNSLFHKEGIL